ncbi:MULTISPECIES: PIN domain-containing protein [unclassified Streptomyces]|uniref:PIN domain-containing protein n=1 Tax=unclassified Streptomyces TaxID=2593676 RepID=UPI002E115535|nr:PIN domain-containing protein [Streptomyces sp. NBC_01197]WSS49317.1 PIN domain-containing protein [Streptomyces sp. NBC_01180]
MIVIGDTSGLVAALNTSDPEHEAARKALRKASTTVVSPLVLMEIEHITTRNVNRRAAHSVNDWLLGQERTLRVLIPEVSAETLRKARGIQNRYSALVLDLADAVNVVLAEAYETDCVLTLDRRDFRAVRPLTGHQAFRVLPDDL